MYIFICEFCLIKIASKFSTKIKIEILKLIQNLTNTKQGSQRKSSEF